MASSCPLCKPIPVIPLGPSGLDPHAMREPCAEVKVAFPEDCEYMNDVVVTNFLIQHGLFAGDVGWILTRAEDIGFDRGFEAHDGGGG